MRAPHFRHFTCDLIVADAEGRHFEWKIEMDARSAWEAIRMAEIEVAGWNHSARIREVALEEQADQSVLGNGDRIELFAPPREVVQVQRVPLMKRLTNWLAALVRKSVTPV